MAITIVIPAAGAITAVANVPSYTLVSPKIVFQEHEMFPLLKGRDAVNDFGGGLYSFEYEEEITFNGTDTAYVLNKSFPVGALVMQVSARVTEEITTIANWKIGTFLDDDAYVVANSNLTAGYTVTNCACYNPAQATSPVIGGQNEIRVTTNAGGAGKLRVAVAGFYFKPFTS